MYFRILVIALCVGIVVSVKRTWIGFFLGRKTYGKTNALGGVLYREVERNEKLIFIPSSVNYASDLTKVMKKIILLSKVAHLAKGVEEEYVLESRTNKVHQTRALCSGVTSERLAYLVNDARFDDDDGSGTGSDGLSCEQTVADQTPYVIDPDEKDKLTGAITDAQHVKVNKLLGAWEEPEKAMGVEVRRVFCHVSQAQGVQRSFSTRLFVNITGGSVCACNS
jgi:hypothetical protein